MARLGILVVAYNAAATLAGVLDRIPPEFRDEIDEILVSDDASSDATHLVGLGYQQQGTDLPLTVIRQPVNLGYGGNQKAGYRWAIEHDLDYVVLLHGDGQYAPECLPDIVAPLLRGEADAVFGSRMMNRGEARAGGMPRYKYVGNRILSSFQNAMTGASLSEWHSGYRAYSVRALAELNFDSFSNDFDFDTEIILGLLQRQLRIVEVPIPTYYGDEICYVNGMGYARDVVGDVVRYRLGRMGFGGEPSDESGPYELKADRDTSHGRILTWAGRKPPGRVLDLGCSDGRLAAALRLYGHTVIGVDIEAHKGVHDRVDEFVQADLDRGIPQDVGDDFDLIVCADVLEHVREPGRLLADARTRLAAGGTIIASVPNFAHWYPRARVALGRFDYDRRGILDRGHVRFFTRRSFERVVASAGLRVRRRDAVGIPIEVVDRGRVDVDAGARGRPSAVKATVKSIDRTAVLLWPTLFAFQLVYELDPA